MEKKAYHHKNLKNELLEKGIELVNQLEYQFDFVELQKK